ncbi:MAG: SH3 domain-containing protein [Anaerolineae bacterium]|nr:SH3 domain-containing protein [Anaerolineae bacterium]MDW8171321.1 CARDB domain-containing protein [Anaerolineae bacterium]
MATARLLAPLHPLLLSLLMLATACNLTVPPPPMPSFSGPPIIKIASPQDGEIYLLGTVVNILARIENAGPDLARVQVRLDQLIIGEALDPNPNGAAAFTITNSWPTISEGEYTLSVSAARADGTLSEPTSVTIRVQAQASQTQPSPTTTTETVVQLEASPTSQPQLPAPTPQPQLLQPAQPTPQPQPVQPLAPTPVPPTTAPTVPSAPQARIVQGVNVRSGPGTIFAPPIGSLAANATTTILAVSPGRDWYKIQYYNGSGWIIASAAEVTGDLASLPVEAGPPTPLPTQPPAPTAPSAGPTAISGSSDLVVTAVSGALTCNQPGRVDVTVTNIGTTTSGPTRVLVESVARGNQVAASASFDVGAIDPRVPVDGSVTLTVTTFVGEEHVLRVTIDPDNRIPETNEGNNQNSGTRYILQSGGC